MYIEVKNSVLCDTLLVLLLFLKVNYHINKVIEIFKVRSNLTTLLLCKTDEHKQNYQCFNHNDLKMYYSPPFGGTPQSR